jgi:hypothetical protein
MKTEGSDSTSKHPYLKQIPKNVTPTKLTKKTDEWKFISIQLKDDLSKPKNVRKAELKINSHRSYNLQYEGSKGKSNSSISKYL